MLEHISHIEKEDISIIKYNKNLKPLNKLLGYQVISHKYFRNKEIVSCNDTPLLHV